MIYAAKLLTAYKNVAGAALLIVVIILFGIVIAFHQAHCAGFHKKLSSRSGY